LQWFYNYVLGQNEVELHTGGLVGHDVVNVATRGDNPSGYQTLHRFYAWGNDQTGTCVILTRGQPFVFATYEATQDVMTAFGLPEDETLPLPANNINRLFVVGQNQNANHVTWDCGTFASNGISGIAYSLDLKVGPISCVMAQYVYAALAESDGYAPRFDSAAGNTPFLSGAELISVDLIAGTYASLYAAASTYTQGFNMEPRRIGRFPIARTGWATGQTAWATADTAMTWFHANNGVYLPWGGITGL